MTGEQGPELRYETQGGFIAHNRALRAMLDMASRTRDLVSGIGSEGLGASPVPALATVAETGLTCSAGRSRFPRNTTCP